MVKFILARRCAQEVSRIGIFHLLKFLPSLTFDTLFHSSSLLLLLFFLNECHVQAAEYKRKK